MTDNPNELTPTSPPKDAELLTGVRFDPAKVSELRRRLVAKVLEAIQPENIELLDKRVHDLYSREQPLKFDVLNAEVFVKAPAQQDLSTETVFVYTHNPDRIESTGVFVQHDWFGHDRNEGRMEVEITVEGDSVEVSSFGGNKQQRITKTEAGEIILQIPLATETSGIFEGRQLKGAREALCDLVERIIRDDVMPPEFERKENKRLIHQGQYLVVPSAALIDGMQDDGRHDGMSSTESVSVCNGDLARWREHLEERLRSLPVSSAGASEGELQKIGASNKPKILYLD